MPIAEGFSEQRWRTKPDARLTPLPIVKDGKGAPDRQSNEVAQGARAINAQGMSHLIDTARIEQTNIIFDRDLQPNSYDEDDDDTDICDC